LKAFKKAGDLDEVEINSYLHKSLQLHRKIELYLNEKGRDQSGTIQVRYLSKVIS